MAIHYGHVVTQTIVPANVLVKTNTEVIMWRSNDGALGAGLYLPVHLISCHYPVANTKHMTIRTCGTLLQ